MDAAIINNCLQGACWNDQRQASTAKLARVTYRHGLLCNFNHHPVDFGFKKVWRAQAIVDVKTIHAEEEYVGVQSAESFFRDRTNQRKRILAKRTTCKDDFHRGSRQLRGNVYGVRDNRNVMKVA